MNLVSSAIFICNGVERFQNNEKTTENGSCFVFRSDSVESKKIHIENRYSIDNDDETSHNINSLLKAEGISICEDEDLGGKTVPIGALDVGMLLFPNK